MFLAAVFLMMVWWRSSSNYGGTMVIKVAIWICSGGQFEWSEKVVEDELVRGRFSGVWVFCEGRRLKIEKVIAFFMVVHTMVDWWSRREVEGEAIRGYTRNMGRGRRRCYAAAVRERKLHFSLFPLQVLCVREKDEESFSLLFIFIIFLNSGKGICNLLLLIGS